MCTYMCVCICICVCVCVCVCVYLVQFLSQLDFEARKDVAIIFR